MFLHKNKKKSTVKDKRKGFHGLIIGIKWKKNRCKIVKIPIFDRYGTQTYTGFYVNDEKEAQSIGCLQGLVVHYSGELVMHVPLNELKFVREVH